MRSWTPWWRGGVALLVLALLGTGAVIVRGFSASATPTAIETVVARALRDFAMPRAARNEQNPLRSTSALVAEGRDLYVARCATCHGGEGDGNGKVGRNQYPRASNLRVARTQQLTDGQLHYFIEHGVQHTGMPATDNAQRGVNAESWKLLLYVRSIRENAPAENAQVASAVASATYVGSGSCAKCHAEIYKRWKKTPMANVVRDPREHPEAIIPDLATNKVAPFAKEQVALVYGSIWKQRYFTKVGDDLYPLAAQWDIANKTWRPYNVPKTGDWWTAYYPPDNMHRATGPTCDGCHSVNYDIRTKTVTEWNVGCEKCHGPASAHIAHPVRSTILNPTHLDFVGANDTCIQCHSQGRPRVIPIDRQYYDWPVGYTVGRSLADVWSLEQPTLGETSFTHFPDGTAHKNRMQGNDFVQSQMYKHGVTCFTCHDSHGTPNYAQLRKPADELCIGCHAPMSANGPATPTLEAHTHHKVGSTGSACISCHMPKVATEGVPGTFVRAHTFRFITPTMTDRYKIPNACTSCHADKSTAWATAAMKKWPEHSPWRVE